MTDLSEKIHERIIQTKIIDLKDSNIMQFYSAFKKTMMLLKIKKTINFFFKNALQKKRIKKLVQAV